MAKKVKKTLPWFLILALMAVTIGAGSGFSALKVRADVETPSTSGVVGNVAPSVSGVNLTDADGGDIGLTENTTTTVYCTSTITDENGGADISSCTAVIYRSGVGADCTADNNNCYLVSSANCTLGSAVGNDKNATATADIYFHADPTDTGSYATAQGWAGQTWQCQLKGIDAANASSTATDSVPPEITTLTALNADSSITYDALNPGQNMASTTVALNATTTGNVPIDVELKGNNMISGVNSIAVGNQRYATSTVAFASGVPLTDTYTALEVDMPKPTTSPSNSTDVIYWGWAVPSGTPAGTYTGTNYLNAIQD